MPCMYVYMCVGALLIIDQLDTIPSANQLLTKLICCYCWITQIVYGTSKKCDQKVVFTSLGVCIYQMPMLLIVCAILQHNRRKTKALLRNRNGNRIPFGAIPLYFIRYDAIQVHWLHVLNALLKLHCLTSKTNSSLTRSLALSLALHVYKKLLTKSILIYTFKANHHSCSIT